MKINLNNYEEYLLTYVDGELDEATTHELMQFLKIHPEIQKELEVLQMTVLPEDGDVHFPDKKLLYREKEPAAKKVFILRRYPWISTVAAACIALLVILYLQPWKSTLPANTGIAVNPSVPSVNPPANPASGVKDTLSASVATSEKNQKNSTAILAVTSHPKTLQTKQREHKASTIIVENKRGNEMATTAVKPDLPALSTLDITLQDAEGKTSLAAVPIAIEHEVNRIDEAKTNQLPEPGTSKIDTKRKVEIMDDKITNATEMLVMTKQGLDSTITRKLDDINQKTSGFINHIAKNGIKIGKLTIAFNN